MMKHIKRTRSLLTLLFIALLVACGGGSSTSAPQEGESSQGDDKANEASDEVFKLKMNTMYPPTEPGWEWSARALSTEVFADRVKERSDGRIEIEIYHGNQLAGQQESLDALAKGTFDIQNATPSAWADKIPEGNIAALPFWTPSDDHAVHMLRETEIGELYEEALNDYGVKPLVYWAASATGYMSTSPISSPEDLDGKVMNTTSSLTNDYYKKMGAGLATVSLAEQYEGLMRGTIDAIQYPYYSLDTYQLHEVIDYITVPPTLSTAMGLLTISNITWEKLPSDLQDILMEVSQEIEAEALEASKKLTQIGFEFAEEKGVEIIKLTEENYNKFFELSKETTWKNFENINDRTKKMIEVLEEETEKWFEEHPEDEEAFKEYFSE